MTELAPTPDPHAAYWHTVATSAPHRWIALTTDWRVADYMMRQRAALLPGWPMAPAVDWFNGPYAADWWLPCHGRRVVVTAWTDADAHLASLVMPVIEIVRPARLVFRSYRAGEQLLPASAPTLSATVPAPATIAPVEPHGANETGHAAAA